MSVLFCCSEDREASSSRIKGLTRTSPSLTAQGWFFQTALLNGSSTWELFGAQWAAGGPGRSKETHKKNRQGPNKIWVVLGPPFSTVNYGTGELLDSREEKSFTYFHLWGEITKYSVLKEQRTGLCRMMPPKPMPKCTQAAHKPAHSACHDQSHCLRPHIILEYLLLLLTAVFQGSFSLWIT